MFLNSLRKNDIEALVEFTLKVIKGLESPVIDEIYPASDAVFHHQMKKEEESWKYNVQWSIFDKLQGVSSGDETLCWMLVITSQTKGF